MLRKFYLPVASAIALSTFSFAQDKSAGIIYFDQEINTKAMTSGAGGGSGTVSFSASSGGAMSIPDKIINRFELLFSAAGTKFQKAADDGASTGGLQIRVGGAGRDLFFKDSIVIESFEMDGEQLLLQTKLGVASKSPEKSDETQKIIGFNCHKAVVNGMNNSKVTIWYTTELPFKATPMAQFWTEGTVLGIENDRMKFIATSIDYTKIKDTEFALPKKSKLVTQEEYNKKMADFRAKMSNGMAMPGGGNVTTIIRQN